MEKRRYKPCLPSLIMGNVRSLANKMDELTAVTKSQKEYRECSLMCFNETWLHQDIPDNNVSISGFQTVRADRDCTESGKRKGGGLAVLVNNRWCSPDHISIKERICCPDIELFAVGLRPYYLPREFSHAIIVTDYIPPSANPTSACDVIHSAIARLQTKHPSAFIAISGDFNHVTMATTLPTFTQYVSCPTREERTLDLLYANAKDAYSCSPLPPLGRSDHNLVHLNPCYVPLVKSQPATMRTVRRWSEETYETLQVALWTTALGLREGVPLGPVRSRVTITTDASEAGWGTLWGNHPAWGRWGPFWRGTHINLLELEAVYRALVYFLPVIQGKHVLVQINNSTVVAYINHQGGLRSWSLHNLAKSSSGLMLRVCP
ncbi:uncharacterized protein LOC126407114 [Epinephelus moara]|uniref:uncharacterized protein LOC126407114 n=1 Tax=Epinephelus moara TaxID=300413 RepID=UPI00214E1AA5|nr:uncharacterized protein LOC126407114 [Epinephelus moara]